MAACTSLVRLDLSNNGIGASAGWALATCLRTANLQCLLLSHNRLGSNGAEAIAAALCESGGKCLKMLLLQ